MQRQQSCDMHNLCWHCSLDKAATRTALSTVSALKTWWLCYMYLPSTYDAQGEKTTKYPSRTTVTLGAQAPHKLKCLAINLFGYPHFLDQPLSTCMSAELFYCFKPTCHAHVLLLHYTNAQYHAQGWCMPSHYYLISWASLSTTSHPSIHTVNSCSVQYLTFSLSSSSSSSSSSTYSCSQNIQAPTLIDSYSECI